MIYLFTSSDLWGSKLIEWGTESEISHVVFASGDRPNSLVIESRLQSGVRETTLNAIAGNEFVFALKPKSLSNNDSKILYEQLKPLIGKKYDYAGIAYFAIAIVWFRKILKRKIPKKNAWASNNDHYCSELAKTHEKFLKTLGVKMDKYGDQMLSPAKFCELLIESGSFKSFDLKKEMKLNE